MKPIWKEVLKAARFAKEIHKGQTRLHGAPAYSHPKAVARLIYDHGIRDAKTLQLAYLHDVLEDGPKSAIHSLIDLFPVDLVADVVRLTKKEYHSYSEYLGVVKEAGMSATIVKVFDRKHNNSEISLIKNEYEKQEMLHKSKIKSDLISKVLYSNIDLWS